MDSYWFSFWRVLIVLALPGAFSPVLIAGIRPSFNLDVSSWRATDIVSVLTTEKDCVFEVQKSWKGDLRPGDNIAVKELAPAPGALPIAVYPGRSMIFADPSGPILEVPKQPPGSRMVLFLARNDSSGGPSSSKTLAWAPSNLFRDFKTAVFWIDGGKTYAFQQLINPGPSMLIEVRASEAALLERVAEVLRVQEDLNEALRIEDGSSRAARLKLYAHSNIRPASQFALEQLGLIGPPATATIREMLDDATLSGHAALIKTYVKAGGEAVGEDLNRRLREQLSFWRGTAHSLEKGWWNQEQTATREALRDHYSETLELVVALQKVHCFEALASVTDLRSLWKSVSALEDSDGLDQMSLECDRLVEHLSQ